MTLKILILSETCICVYMCVYVCVCVFGQTLLCVSGTKERVRVRATNSLFEMKSNENRGDFLGQG